MVKALHGPEDPLLEHNGEQDIRNRPNVGLDRRILIASIMNFVVLSASILLFVMSRAGPGTRNTALKATSLYSPILDDIDIDFQTVAFNGSLFPGSSPSPWRQPPNPTSNAAWAEFEHIHTLVLTRADILKMRKDPAVVAKYEDSYWHLGDDAYIGALDFFHQVHCLNTIRYKVFEDYGQSERTPDLDKMQWIHLQHCMDMLMQHLLCTADTGMLTYKWKKGADNPHPDMSVNRQCKDWRQLVEYRDAKMVDQEKYLRYQKPDDAVEGEWPKEYLEYLKEKSQH